MFEGSILQPELDVTQHDLIDESEKLLPVLEALQGQNPKANVYGLALQMMDNASGGTMSGTNQIYGPQPPDIGAWAMG